MNRSYVGLPSLLLLVATGCAHQSQQLSSPADRGLAAIAHACVTDRTHLDEELAAAIGVAPRQVIKAVGRHTVMSLDQGDLCARPENERRIVIAAAMEPRKTTGSRKSQKASDWLLRQLGGPSGVIDPQMVANAMERRAQILAESQQKRAGLPALPSGWTNVTGYTQSPGRINHILFTDGTGNNILAGADGGGIWRSTDGGNSWSAINDLLGSLSITNLARAGNDSSTIYAGTNAQGSHTYFPYGVMKSIDGGSTWNQVAAPLSLSGFSYVQRVAVHPLNSSYVLAATAYGAYVTTNGGVTWSQVPGTPTVGSTAAYFVAIHPTNGNLQAIAYDNGTIRYTTTGDLVGAGASSTVLAGGRYMKIAYAKSDVNRMYALVTDGTSFATRMFESVNGAAGPWNEISLTVAGMPGGVINGSGYLSYTGAIWVDPLNAARVAICEFWCAFTANIDAGTSTTWKKLYSGWVDFHGIVEHPGYNGGANTTVFFMDDGGLYKVNAIDSIDQASAFSRIENGLTVTEVYSVSAHGGNPILGAQDVSPKVFANKACQGDATVRWRFIGGNVSSFCTDPCFCSWIGDGMTTAASTVNPQALYISRQYMDIIRSTDGGQTGVSVIAGSSVNEGLGVARPNGNYNAPFHAPFVLDPSNQSRMLAGGYSLWRANDVDTGNPPTWSAIKPPRPGIFGPGGCGTTGIGTIAIAPTSSDTVWIAYECDGEVYKTTNGTAATPVFSRIFPPGTSVGAILVDRTNPNRVWVGFSQYTANPIALSTDGGATWTNIPSLPSAPVNALAQHPSNPLWIYAGTSLGLFASQDGGATWSTSNEGPANVVVRSLDWNTTTNPPELWVGTFGRGVFKAPIASATLAASTTTLNVSSQTVTTGASVTFTATVSGGSGTATGSVSFNEGVTTLATVPLTAAQAVFSTASLAVGMHSITANYSGDSTYNPSSSASVNVLVSTPTVGTRLTGISTRMQVLTGNNVLIGGFIITGSTPKTVVINARGPSLAQQGVAGAMADPYLQVVSAANGSVISNDDWGSAPYAPQLTSLGLAPPNPKESSVLATLNPGAYTAIVSGVAGGTGIGIVEVFEVDHPEIPLTGISTRGLVQTGNNVMIGGFIIQGSTPQTVVVRGRGPSLAAQGVTGTLQDPFLQLVSAADGSVITNDNWQTAANATQLQSIGYAPTDPREAALLVTLNPGAYTAIVSGAGGTTGIGIVEVYAP